MPTRPSPTESATLYKEGTIKTGNDGNKWIIAVAKNGTKRWKLHKKVTTVKASNEKVTKKEPVKKTKKTKRQSKKPVVTLEWFYGFKPVTVTQLSSVAQKDKKTKVVYNKLMQVLDEINKLNIETYIVPLPLSNNNVYWTDYANSFISEKYDGDYLNKTFLYFEIYMNHQGTEINTNNEKSTQTEPEQKKEIPNDPLKAALAKYDCAPFACNFYPQ